MGKPCGLGFGRVSQLMLANKFQLLFDVCTLWYIVVHAEKYNYPLKDILMLFVKKGKYSVSMNIYSG